MKDTEGGIIVPEEFQKAIQRVAAEGIAIYTVELPMHALPPIEKMYSLEEIIREIQEEHMPIKKEHIEFHLRDPNNEKALAGILVSEGYTVWIENRFLSDSEMAPPVSVLCAEKE